MGGEVPRNQVAAMMTKMTKKIVTKKRAMTPKTAGEGGCPLPGVRGMDEVNGGSGLR